MDANPTAGLDVVATASDLVAELRRRVFEATKLTASAGTVPLHPPAQSHHIHTTRCTSPPPHQPGLPSHLFPPHRTSAPSPRCRPKSGVRLCTPTPASRRTHQAWMHSVHPPAPAPAPTFTPVQALPPTHCSPKSPQIVSAVKCARPCPASAFPPFHASHPALVPCPACCVLAQLTSPTGSTLYLPRGMPS